MPNKDKITIMAVGDIMMGDHPVRIGHGVNSVAKKMGSEFLFDRVAPFLRDADISFGNLEAVLSAKNLRNSLCSLQLRASPNSVKGLKIAGFNVLSLANNHSMEHGPDAFIETVDILNANGIKPVGLLGTSHNCIPQVIRRKGVLFGFLGYSFQETKSSYRPLYAQVGSSEGIFEDVKALSEKADIIIVSLHWGDEYIQRPSPEQIKLAHKLVDTGVNIILGHHPHCLQGIESYKKGLIAYSLGNFIFDYWQKKMRESIILRIDVSKKGIIDYSTTPIYINDCYQPEILHGQEQEKLLSKIIRLSDKDKFCVSANGFVKYKTEVLREKRRWQSQARKYFITHFYKYPLRLYVQSLTHKIKRVLWSLTERTAIISKLWHRRGFVTSALGNWGLHFADTVTFRNEGNPKGKKIIVFVRAISDIRLFKEAKALRNSGEYYTIFFTKVIDRNLMRPAFDEIHPLINMSSMVRKIKSIGFKSDILAIHVSSPPANICRRLIEMNLPWPIIFDQYDSYLVARGAGYENDSNSRMYDMRQQIEDEKYCYENAQGVISKTTEINYVKSILNVTRPTLIYPDYALEDWFVEPHESVRTTDGRPHLVYAGGVHGKCMPDGTVHSKFFDFAQNLNNQRIHFHIYPSPGQTVAANGYKELAKKLPFFHFHKPKKPWEIQKEIGKYDFALDVAWHDNSSLKQEKTRTATGNKFATYLEAGLPIIVNEGVPYDAKKAIDVNIGFIIENDKSIIPHRALNLR